MTGIAIALGLFVAAWLVYVCLRSIGLWLASQ